MRDVRDETVFEFITSSSYSYRLKEKRYNHNNCQRHEEQIPFLSLPTDRSFVMPTAVVHVPAPVINDQKDLGLRR